MNYKIELTREELTTILQVATGNVKDFVMDNDKFINKHLAAINYTHSCTELPNECGLLKNINGCDKGSGCRYPNCA